MRRMRNISFLRAPGALHLLKLRLIQVGGHHARSTGGHWRRSASFQGHLQLVPGQSGAGESLLAAGTGNGARRATKAAQAQTLAPLRRLLLAARRHRRLSGGGVQLEVFQGHRGAGGGGGGGAQ